MGKDQRVRKILASDNDWVIVIRENGEVETNMEDGQTACQYKGLFILVTEIMEKAGEENCAQCSMERVEEPEEEKPILNLLPPRLVR